MSVKIWKYFISMFLVLGISVAFSQDSTKKSADTVRSKYIPTGLRLGTDVISIIKSHATDNFKGWETNADVDFYKYFLTADYGSWSRRDSIVFSPSQPQTTKGKYENNGHYIRLGVDVNILLKDPERNMVFIGFRYGLSTFNQKFSYNYPDKYYGLITKTISDNALRGHWAEITGGLRVKIFPGFWMGYTARYKFAASVKGGSNQLTPYDLPGYGLVAPGHYWGFNYQLFWRIPYRKIDIIAPPKK